MNREADLAAVSDRLARIEDRIALTELAARYCHLLDDAEIEELIELFTSDGKLLRDDILAAAGTEALVEFYRQARSNFSLSFHYPHSQIITFTSSSSATGIVSAHAEMGIDGQCVLAGLRYHDKYAKHDGRWLFLQRSVQFLYRLGWDEMSEAYNAERG